MIYQAHPETTFKSKIKSSLSYILAATITGFAAQWIRIRLFDYVFLASGFLRFRAIVPGTTCGL